MYPPTYPQRYPQFAGVNFTMKYYKNRLFLGYKNLERQ